MLDVPDCSQVCARVLPFVVSYKKYVTVFGLSAVVKAVLNILCIFYLGRIVYSYLAE